MTITIGDDDAPPVVSFGPVPTTFPEIGGALELPVELSAPSALATSISFTLAGTVTSGSDYTVPVSPLQTPPQHELPP